MDEYITKPIETTELLYVLNKFLSDKAISHTKEPAPVEEPAVEEKVEQEPEEIVTPANDAADEPVELAIDQPTVDLVETPKEKKILVAKKFLLARRVFAKVLENLGHEYDSLDDMNMLENTLATGDYDILFADADLITERISDSNQNVAIITSSDSKNPQEVAVQKGETISSTASKEETENIITKYRG
jgi:CheY-like chemotaxis protein